MSLEGTNEHRPIAIVTKHKNKASHKLSGAFRLSKKTSKNVLEKKSVPGAGVPMEPCRGFESNWRVLAHSFYLFSLFFSESSRRVIVFADSVKANVCGSLCTHVLCALDGPRVFAKEVP